MIWSVRFIVSVYALTLDSCHENASFLYRL